MFWNVLARWAACLLLCAQTLAGPPGLQVNQAPRPALPLPSPQHPDLVPPSCLCPVLPFGVLSRTTAQESPGDHLLHPLPARARARGLLRAEACHLQVPLLEGTELVSE